MSPNVSDPDRATEKNRQTTVTRSEYAKNNPQTRAKRLVQRKTIRRHESDGPCHSKKSADARQLRPFAEKNQKSRRTSREPRQEIARRWPSASSARPIDPARLLSGGELFVEVARSNASIDGTDAFVSMARMKAWADIEPRKPCRRRSFSTCARTGVIRSTARFWQVMMRAGEDRCWWCQLAIWFQQPR